MRTPPKPALHLERLFRALGLLALPALVVACPSTPPANPAGGSGGSAGMISATGGQGGSGAAPVSLPECDVLGQIDVQALPESSRETDSYEPPSAERMARFREAVALLADEDLAGARDAAAAADYTLCAGTGEQEGLRFLEATDTSGQALVVLRKEAAGALIVGAPHAFYELDTLNEARVVFEELEARALIVTGSHRCANTDGGTCDGTTRACSETAAPFRTSDMAHVAESLYQVAHEVLAERFAADVVLSLHGMSRDGASVSDGTSGVASAESITAKLTDALTASFPELPITTCNDYGGENFEAHLCGTTNVQGRHVNGSPGACTLAGTDSGRFIHLEQSLDVRAQPLAVAAALAAALP